MTTTTPSSPHARSEIAVPNSARTVRPWLLAAKVIAVALYVGGLAAVTFVWVGSGYNALPVDDPRRTWLINLVGRMMVFFVVPMLIVAMLLGVALLRQRPRAFLRTRWLRAKLVILLVMIPAGHFWCRAQTLKLRADATPIEAHARAARSLSAGLVGTLAGSITVVVIGRLKPRFGQSAARDT
jgi:uncharacterized membrane protein